MLKLVLSLPTAFIFGTFRHPSSVTKIGSEEPILATASPPGEAFLRRVAALGGHRPPQLQQFAKQQFISLRKIPAPKKDTPVGTFLFLEQGTGTDLHFRRGRKLW